MQSKRLIAFLPLIVAGLLLVNACEAADFVRRGMLAEQRGDWDTARTSYAQAVKDWEQRTDNPLKLGLLHYEYGRSLGVTCYFDDAERELNLAYDYDKKSGQPLYLSLDELARLNFDQKKYLQAVSYYERAIPELDGAGAEKGAPIAYADLLNEYATALDGAGRSKDAEKIKDRADKIRASNPGGFSNTDRTPYGKYCAKP